MNTLIHSIPHKYQRYNTLGDYQKVDYADGAGTLQGAGVLITVSQLGDWRYEFLIALHEFIEEALTRHRGIAEPDIMAFDLAHPDADDPGMLPEAPYHREHVTATAIEMLIAQELGVDWTAYGKACGEATKA